jgi:uncharacterized protein (UPF0147 family)
MGQEELNNVIDTLRELMEDNTVPKNIKSKIEEIITLLRDEGDESMKISKALGELDEIANDVNLQPYTRTQVWNVASMLEML